MEELKVLTYFWFDPDGKKNHIYVFDKEHVLLLKNQLKRHLTIPHEFVVATDRPELLEGTGIRTVMIDKSKHLPATRYIKLQTFKPEMKELVGSRILQLDLDTVIVRNINHLVDREEDLVLWRNPNYGGWKRARYNTSMLLYRAGTRPEFWNKFDPKEDPQRLKGRVGGTDQAFISDLAAPNEAWWDDSDGVYGAGRLLDIVPGVQTVLPDNACIVFFPGSREPGMKEIQDQHPWITEHRY